MEPVKTELDLAFDAFEKSRMTDEQLDLLINTTYGALSYLESSGDSKAVVHVLYDRLDVLRRMKIAREEFKAQKGLL